MTKIKDLPKIELPREKLIKYGVEKLTNAELLAILLRTGTSGTNVIELAKLILKKFDKAKLVNLKVENLKDIKGLGAVKACEIVASLEFGRRILKDKKSVLLLSPKDIWQELKDLRGHKKEHFVIFYLDTGNQEIKREIISVGTLNASLVHPREVFEPAIKHLAAQIIVAHNHPSGQTEPSAGDLEVNKRLMEAGKLLGIELADHIIVTIGGFYSFKENKLIDC